jgi:hypothetical protein
MLLFFPLLAVLGDTKVMIANTTVADPVLLAYAITARLDAVRHIMLNVTGNTSFQDNFKLQSTPMTKKVLKLYHSTQSEMTFMKPFA